MNSTRIEKEFSFLVGAHFEDSFYMNSYDITLSMHVETDSIREQNIAMDRIRYFLEEVFQNSIAIYQGNEETIKKYRDANLKVCELIEDPYDQIIGMTILRKMNAIMEGRLAITSLMIESVLSDGVRCEVLAETASDIFAGPHWWNTPTLVLSDNGSVKQEADNIVKLFSNHNDWIELGLTWKEKGAR